MGDEWLAKFNNKNNLQQTANLAGRRLIGRNLTNRRNVCNILGPYDPETTEGATGLRSEFSTVPGAFNTGAPLDTSAGAVRPVSSYSMLNPAFSPTESLYAALGSDPISEPAALVGRRPVSSVAAASPIRGMANPTYESTFKQYVHSPPPTLDDAMEAVLAAQRGPTHEEDLARKLAELELKIAQAERMSAPARKAPSPVRRPAPVPVVAAPEPTPEYEPTPHSAAYLGQTDLGAPAGGAFA